MKKILILFIFLTFISNNALSFIIRDSEIENIIKEIVAPIAEAAEQDKEKLKIFIINDKQLNAFVTPGQKIFIFSGLIVFLSLVSMAIIPPPSEPASFSIINPLNFR